MLQLGAALVAPKQWYIFFIIIYGVQRVFEISYHSWRSVDNNNYQWYHVANDDYGFYTYSGYITLSAPLILSILGCTVEILMWVLGTSDFLEL